MKNNRNFCYVWQLKDRERIGNTFISPFMSHSTILSYDSELESFVKAWPINLI
jgi:hypothetical protein